MMKSQDMQEIQIDILKELKKIRSLYDANQFKGNAYINKLINTLEKDVSISNS